MCRIKFVIVLLCLVNFVQPRKLYYPIPDDPSAIYFPGLTNYDTRKASENEVNLDEDTLGELINPRFGKIGVKGHVNPSPPPPEEPVDTGFYFPDD